MGFFAAVGSSYANILNFSGRASRAEYWWFLLFQFAVIFGLSFGLIYYFMGNVDPEQAAAIVAQYTGIWSVVYFIGFWLPGLSSLVRRLHDTDHSGWWFFIGAVPIIGFIVLLFFFLMPGTPGRNRFGNDPYGKKGKVKVRLPRGMKPAPSEAERRAEILEYYRKNVAAQGQPS